MSRPAGNGYHQAGWQDRTSAPAPDVEAEADDQLMSLPEECDAHLSHSHQNNSQDIPATGAPPAPMQVQAPPLHDTSQFSRLDPNRRSFSSPAVNLLVQQQQQHLLAGQCRRSCVRQIQTGSAPEAGSPECGRKQKQRRRTALGLISLGSSHFRPSQLVASSCGQTVAQHQIPATRQATSWRTWFTIGGSMTSSSGQANKQPRKFLLRNLKPRASTTVRGEYDIRPGMIGADEVLLGEFVWPTCGERKEGRTVMVASLFQRNRLTHVQANHRRPTMMRGGRLARHLFKLGQAHLGSICLVRCTST